MTDWATLEAELDAWASAGREAGFWWRDDDAVAPGPELDRLLDLARDSGAPLALAVIPARAEAALAACLDGHTARVQVLQHGIAHENHAPAGAKKCELVDPAAAARLSEEQARLAKLFGERFLPVLVPPWNRLAPEIVPQLPTLGYRGLSTYRPRSTATPVPHLQQVNCHLDILQWRPERRFLGTAAAISLLTGHLAARRLGVADTAEPSGILTHHLVHDPAAWDFLGELLNRLMRHPAARLLPAREVFAAGPAHDGRGEETP